MSSSQSTVRKRNKIALITIGVVLVAMVILNPSPKHFSEFAKEKLEKKGFKKSFLDSAFRCNRSQNFLIMSKYYFYINDYGVNIEGDYVGVFGFFIPLRTIGSD
jgi:hypothetical protein